MRRIKIALSVAALGAAVFLQPGVVFAQNGATGIATAASQLPEQARSSLVKEIQAYKAAHPEAFEAVRNVQGHRPEVYSRFRNPVPVVGRELKRLGPAALLPMLEALAFEAPARGSLTDREWEALTVGMLEAVGALRDAKSGPVLRAVFEGSSKSAPVLKAAAVAMGRLCGDAELALLTKRSAAGDALRIPAIQGLGYCMREASAKHLAGLLAAAPDDATAEVLGEALGMVASSWAWKTLGASAEAEGAAVRAIAAKALVPAFVRYGGEARAAMRRGLLMAEHKATPELIAKARPTADAQTAAELDAVASQIARKSPQK
jgi:hypothetical protein